jgi:haloalkane dehalogenase
MHRIDVLGSQMAYVDAGPQGAAADAPVDEPVDEPVVLFLHGNPTSSYLWCNVIPHVAPAARCVAPDLIGFGQSDKPAIAYRAADHARYLDAFIRALGLREVVLVLHDWGSALGFDWARRHEASVHGLVFMEFIRPFPTWADFAAPGDRRLGLFQAFRDPDRARKLLIEDNAFIEQVLPGGVVRGLAPACHDAYRRPFLDPAHREPIRRFPCELPIAGEPVDVYAMVTAYHDWLLETSVPKLMFWARPGALIPAERAAWYVRRLRNLQAVELGEGRHFLPEDHPDAIGMRIADWLADLSRHAS